MRARRKRSATHRERSAASFAQRAARSFGRNQGRNPCGKPALSRSVTGLDSGHPLNVSDLESVTVLASTPSAVHGETIT
jgi:hypothetical protein